MGPTAYTAVFSRSMSFGLRGLLCCVVATWVRAENCLVRNNAVDWLLTEYSGWVLDISDEVWMRKP